jgi:pimeloyl-ACP methyl ester carboxylesterase
MSAYFKSFDGTNIWYKYIKGKKTTIFFLHGLSGSTPGWNWIYPKLAKKGHSILLMDLRGHGLSEKPVGEEKYTIESCVKDVTGLLRTLKIRKIIFVCHSFGGILALEIYKKSPKTIKKICIISGLYNLSKDKVRKIGNKLIYNTYYLLSFLTSPLHFERNRLHLDYSSFKGSHDLSPNRIYTDIKLTSFQTYLPLWKELLLVDHTETLKSLEIPLLLIHGRNDIILPVEGAIEMNNLAKDSRISIIEGNHIIIISFPELISDELTKFLS